MKKVGFVTLVCGITLCLLMGTAAYAQGSDVDRNRHDAAFALFDEILWYMDRESRFGCESKNSPRYFPQFPTLTISVWQNGVKSPAENIWSDLPLFIRQIAPTVRLVSNDGLLPDTYRLEIMDITGLEGELALITYQHSTFNFKMFETASAGFARGDALRSACGRPERYLYKKGLVFVSLQCGSKSFHEVGRKLSFP